MEQTGEFAGVTTGHDNVNHRIGDKLRCQTGQNGGIHARSFHRVESLSGNGIRHPLMERYRRDGLYALAKVGYNAPRKLDR